MVTQVRDDGRSGAIRSNIRDAPTDKSRHLGATQDKYFIPREIADAFADHGWSLEFKRDTLLGQRDVEHQVALSQNGWEPVSADQAPGMMPEGYSGPVVRGGAVLMCRPTYLTEQARKEALDRANDQVRNNVRRLGATEQGQLPRTAPKVIRDFAPPSEADRRLMRTQTIPD